jgi:N-methylhydantoinase A
MGGVDAESAARGVIRIANLHMENAIRVISVERGHDPADFTLVGFGGAGGLHVFDLADALGIRRVLVPVHPGVLSALGAATGSLRQETGRTVMWTWGADCQEELQQEISRLQTRLRERFREDGFASASLAFELTLDMRYTGQSHELSVPVPLAELSCAAEGFHQAHAARYGTSDPDADIQVVTVRLEARMAPPDVRFPVWPERDEGAAVPDTDSGWVQRGGLLRGDCLEGPCVVVEDFHTVVVPEGWRLTPDRVGNLVGTRKEPE